jgi:hypothetical protein
MGGLQFEDDEPAKSKPAKKKATKKPVKPVKPVKTVVNPEYDPVIGHVSVKSYKLPMFDKDELFSIAKCCQDYQKSHTRAKDKDPITSLEAKCYQDAGKIMEKIKKFLEVK